MQDPLAIWHVVKEMVVIHLPMVSVQLIANRITGIYSNQSFKCSFTNFDKAIDTILTQASDTPLALGFIAAGLIIFHAS